VPSTPPNRISSRRRTWLLLFWGGTALACAGLTLLLVLLARANLFESEPFVLLSVVVFTAGFTLRRVAKRTVESIERGQAVKFDPYGPTFSSFIERHAFDPGPLDLGTAEPEPGLRRHVIAGDTVLIATAAALIVIALVMAM
jgi:hypothetical protein